MNHLNIQSLQNFIPQESKRVQYYFSKINLGQNLGGQAQFSSLAAALVPACACSVANGFLYLLQIPYETLSSSHLSHALRTRSLSTICVRSSQLADSSMKSFSFTALAITQVAKYYFTHFFSSSVPDSSATVGSQIDLAPAVNPNLDVSKKRCRFSDFTEVRLFNEHDSTISHQNEPLKSAKTASKLVQKNYRSLQSSSSLETQENAPFSEQLLSQLLIKTGSSKEEKYLLYFKQINHFLKFPQLQKKMVKHKTFYFSDHVSCLSRLYDALIYNIEHQKDEVHTTYKNFVKHLRRGKEIANKIFHENQNTYFSNPDAQIINLLSYHRFTGFHLYDYCKALVYHTSGPSSTSLSLENFWEEFQKRNALINSHLNVDDTISHWNRLAKQAQGTFNISFDPLLNGSNIPYVYGYLFNEDHHVAILRHGTPISHHDPLGNLSRGLNTVLKPFVNSQIDISNYTSLEVNLDYLAFIEEAGRRRKNILHLIFEDALEKTIGDESSRVKKRIELESYKNFFPAVLSFDNTFFCTFFLISLYEFKDKFIQELFTQGSGFYISEKICQKFEKEEFLKQAIMSCLNDVQSTYFPDHACLSSLQDQQAFIVLSYVRLTHVFLEKLAISFLEAHCKDDIDRGGAFKAILLLDLHFRNQTLSHQALEEILINTIAAPLIVKKQAILGHRAELIQNVLDVMNRQVVQVTSEKYAYSFLPADINTHPYCLSP